MIGALRRWLRSDTTAAEATAQATTHAEAGRLMRLATLASVAVAATLVVVKAATWWLTGSISVLSSLVDSLMDVMASLVNLFAAHPDYGVWTLRVRQFLVPGRCLGVATSTPGSLSGSAPLSNHSVI